MRAAALVTLLALVGCRDDPAELVPNLVEPASAHAQYFHGNCFAGFAVGVDLRIQETQGVEVVLSRLSYRVSDRGTGQLLAEELLDQTALEDRFGAPAIVIRAGASSTFPLAAISPERPSGPVAVTGEVAGVDENGESVVAPFDLSTRIEVSDPGPPSGGACTTTP